MPTPITGDTYAHKEALKALGGRWDSARKAWMVPDHRAAEARAIVEGRSAAGSLVRQTASVPTRTRAEEYVYVPGLSLNRPTKYPWPIPDTAVIVETTASDTVYVDTVDDVVWIALYDRPCGDGPWVVTFASRRDAEALRDMVCHD